MYVFDKNALVSVKRSTIARVFTKFTQVVDDTSQADLMKDIMSGALRGNAPKSNLKSNIFKDISAMEC